MIQANELRIGNAVQDDTGRIGIITEVSKNSVRLKMEFSILKIDTHHDEQGVDVTPIPLTPEILEKAGFVKEDEFYYHPNTMIFELTQKFPSLGYWWAVRRTSLPAAIVIKERFLYLHQLQNLYFALTQTELNINL